MKALLEKAAEYENLYRIVGRAHYLAADHNTSFNRYLGIPVIVITAVVGTTIFGTLSANPTPGWKIATGVFSLAGTILSALQTSLGFSQTAEKHKAAGEAYNAVRRRFSLFLLKYGQTRDIQTDASYENAFAELESIVLSLNDLPKEFPALPDRFYDKAKREKKRNQSGTTETS